MRALVWRGPRDVQVETVPDPRLVQPGDAIVRVRRTALCGTDLRIYDGRVSGMEPGAIIGHEFVGEVMEVGDTVKRLNPGDRVVVSPVVACGDCWFCAHQLASRCDRSNPPGPGAHAPPGQSAAGILGGSHRFGGYAGSHAEYIRVPFADHGAVPVPDGVSDEQALPVSDAFPAGYTAAARCGIRGGDTVAVWGAGAVGLFALKSAGLLGAGRLIAIDRHPLRLRMARDACGAETMDWEHTDVIEALRELTDGRGPDACIDAAGMEADPAGWRGTLERARRSLGLGGDRAPALRQAIHTCRKGGTVSIVAEYGGTLDLALGAAPDKELTIRMGPLHGLCHLEPLMNLVARGEVDPSFVLTHEFSLEGAPQAYRLCRHRARDCVRVMLNPEIRTGLRGTRADGRAGANHRGF